MRSSAARAERGAPRDFGGGGDQARWLVLFWGRGQNSHVRGLCLGKKPGVGEIPEGALCGPCCCSQYIIRYIKLCSRSRSRPARRLSAAAGAGRNGCYFGCERRRIGGRRQMGLILRGTKRNAPAGKDAGGALPMGCETIVRAVRRMAMNPRIVKRGG